MNSDLRHPKPIYSADDELQYVDEHSDYYCHPSGTGFRPAFHSLWHLKELGVVGDLENYVSAAWDEAKAYTDDAKHPPMRVVIIDTPVDYNHPNLKDTINKSLMRDFSRFDLGAFAVLDTRVVPHNDVERENIELAVEAIDPDLSAAIASERTWIDANKHNNELLKMSELQVFGAHGTAVAGLIGARPTTINLREPAFFHGREDGFYDKSVIRQCVELPYTGMNPFCEIVPISVSASPRPEMLINAIQYARAVSPAVVVIADSWERPQDWRGTIWEDLEQAFLSLCEGSLVFCAAGNEDLEKLVYPASLSSKTQGPWAVGACERYYTDTEVIVNDLSYSPDFETAIGLKQTSDGQDMSQWMIRTLSTELPRFDTSEQKIDPWEAIDKELGSPKATGLYPPRDIIATDLPGRFGYNPASYEYVPSPEGEHYEIASLFCRFAGTSASAAIAGGLASLIPPEKLNLSRPAREPDDVSGDLAKMLDLGLAYRLFRKRDH
ncbi:S8 family serine peptidase [Cognatiyoonia sp. IB215182]|uniref:S8 family serine peptidase n=1 Tax=Cognatiyoonia sp. IB215182 TaxID=3097353 RepID=UPI002A17647E|nr:S8 family serine peptidase [Cognatiyoonia sp. IB215182]MDX8355561.1 S8 family serine peptidase [Cognatiyoonia sp. IB215182]